MSTEEYKPIIPNSELARQLLNAEIREEKLQRRVNELESREAHLEAQEQSLERRQKQVRREVDRARRVINEICEILEHEGYV